MKKLTFALAALLTAGSVAAQAVDANSVRIVGKGAAAMLKGTDIASWVNPAHINIRVAGGEVVTINLDRPAYFMLGRNLIYLTPGTELEVGIDPANPTKTTFEGADAVINDYLQTNDYTLGGSLFGFGRRNLRPTFEESVKVFDSIVAARRAELAALDAPAEFKRTESARIDADYLNSLLFYPNNQPTVYGADYQRFTREQFDEANKVYMARIMPLAMPQLAKLAADESLSELELVRHTLLQYSERARASIKLSPRLEAAAQAVSHLDTRGIKGSMTERQFADLEAWGATITQPDIRAEFMARMEPMRSKVTGNRTIDVAVTDLDGVKKMLSDYAGKPIYVDVWATWCGPCKAMAPHYAELSEQFPEVQFIAISVDKNKADWEKFVAAGEHGSVVEIWGGEEVTRAWGIAGIPRFLLIDKNFEIISTNAPRPTNREEITKALSEL